MRIEREDCFKRALLVARQQKAKSWELRVAMSLSILSWIFGKRHIVLAADMEERRIAERQHLLVRGAS
jgi:hypothetical protein